MDPARGVDEALLEATLDVEQGADMVMVKPAGAYLDVIARRAASGARAGGRVPGERRIRDARSRRAATAGSTATGRCSNRCWRSSGRGRT